MKSLVRRLRSIGIEPVTLKERMTASMDESDFAETTDRTEDSDLSISTSCIDGHTKCCMKVRTQDDSLARTSGSNRRSHNGREVRFDTVEIREYRIELGDNPATTSGPPIAIGWKYNPEDTVVLDCDMYEFDREGCRRNQRELALDSDARWNILRDSGVPTFDIALAMNRAKQEREQRQRSYRRRRLDPIVEVAESVKRIVPRER